MLLPTLMHEASFKFLFSSEKQEAEYENKESKDTETPKTRLMYYDLLGLST